MHKGCYSVFSLDSKLHSLQTLHHGAHPLVLQRLLKFRRTKSLRGSECCRLPETREKRYVKGSFEEKGALCHGCLLL